MPLKHPAIAMALVLLGGGLTSLANALVSSTTTKEARPPPLRWLIVGGGPHGVHIVTRLLAEVPTLSHSDIGIVDDSPRLLHKWKARTAATGMGYLRSSASYHLGAGEEDLKRFARYQSSARNIGKKKGRTDETVFAADYQRPRLDFFNFHCDHVIEMYNLDKVHVQGMVTDVVPKDEHVEVEIRQPSGETITSCAENIVLALGSDSLAFPIWASEDLINSGKVRHIFDDDDNNGGSLCQGSSVAIVGGGISAAHLALKLEREKTYGDIHMVCRHELREKQFDTHQDWMMDSHAAQRSEAGGGQGVPKCQRHFASLDSYAERRNVIKRERVAGTMPPAVSRGNAGLRYAIGEGRIRWHECEIDRVTMKGDNTIDLKMSTLAGEDDKIAVDQIILATGFGKRPPCSDLINLIAERNGLELCPCGYPAPDKSLRWHDRIFLAGALAELELGPSARNIAGARMASERIVAATATMSGRSLWHTPDVAV